MSTFIRSSPTIARRQIHLDFHNSPEISDLGSDFDAEQFAKQLEETGTDSVTLFAKCHHGMCYYPTRCGTQHPALKGRDLLGEQIDALHRRGIRCPLYLTVGLDETAAQINPDWRQLDCNGHSVRAEPVLGNKLLPGGWYFMNWLHPDYQDHIEAHLLELFESYAVDGLFFDILVFDQRAGWSPEALRFRQLKGLTGSEPAAFDRFLTAAQHAFTKKFSALIRAHNPSASIFYNAAAALTTDNKAGIRIRAAQQSHYEIESLPSGHWGYFHFPRVARFAAQMNLEWTGQTGRFQKSWGDFGGIKPLPALEYECFRTQALGGAIGIGDQLPPRGLFDDHALKLISSVFEKTRQAEPFYEKAKPFFDIGIIAAGAPGSPAQNAHASESGAVLLCHAARRNPVLLDDASDFDALPAIVLPDNVVMTEQLVSRLRAYHQNRGQLILSHRSGFDADGNWRLDFLPIHPQSQSHNWPTYWRPTQAISKEWAGSDRVVYSSGMNVNAGPDTTVLIERVLPYFQRTDAHFSSHFQAPPKTNPEPYPALISGKGFLYFADPLFRDFRQSAQTYVKDLWCAALERTIGLPFISICTPPSIEVIPMRKNNDLLLTILRYLPVRKAMEIDVIDERLPLTGEVLQFHKDVHPPLIFPSHETLPLCANGAYQLMGKGRLLLTVPKYFSTHA